MAYSGLKSFGAIVAFNIEMSASNSGLEHAARAKLTENSARWLCHTPRASI